MFTKTCTHSRDAHLIWRHGAFSPSQQPEQPERALATYINTIYYATRHPCYQEGKSQEIALASHEIVAPFKEPNANHSSYTVALRLQRAFLLLCWTLAGPLHIRSR